MQAYTTAHAIVPLVIVGTGLYLLRRKAQLIYLLIAVVLGVVLANTPIGSAVEQELSQITQGWL